MYSQTLRITCTACCFWLRTHDLFSLACYLLFFYQVELNFIYTVYIKLKPERWKWEVCIYFVKQTYALWCFGNLWRQLGFKWQQQDYSVWPDMWHWPKILMALVSWFVWVHRKQKKKKKEIVIWLRTLHGVPPSNVKCTLHCTLLVKCGNVTTLCKRKALG